MELQLLSRYAIETVEPYLRDCLYYLGKRYNCKEPWASTATEICAQRLTEGRHVTVIRPRARLDTALGEYTCCIEAEGEQTVVYPGDKRGEVRIKTGLDVEFKVFKGRSDSFTYADGTVGRGIVCSAKYYRASDGSDCVRIMTRAGGLWLRSRQRGRLFDRCLFAPNNHPPMGMGEGLVAVAEWEFTRQIKDSDMRTDPWRWLRTQDTSGRPWAVTESRLDFSAGMRRLSLDDYEVEEVRGRPDLTLQPPYDVVWQPQPGIYVPIRDF